MKNFINMINSILTYGWTINNSSYLSMSKHGHSTLSYLYGKTSKDSDLSNKNIFDMSCSFI